MVRVRHMLDHTREAVRLVADEAVVRPTSFAEITLLQKAVVSILRKYVDDFYRVNRERWEGNHMIYRTIDESDPNLSFGPVVREGKAGGYVVAVRGSERKLVEEIEKLIKDAEALYKQETAEMPRIHFDRHLYQPLLVEHGDKVDVDGCVVTGAHPASPQYCRKPIKAQSLR